MRKIFNSLVMRVLEDEGVDASVTTSNFDPNMSYADIRDFVKKKLDNDNNENTDKEDTK